MYPVLVVSAVQLLPWSSRLSLQKAIEVKIRFFGIETKNYGGVKGSSQWAVDSAHGIDYGTYKRLIQLL